MKKENTYRKLLGVSQKDLALLLGISRSHLSMFEIGKRSLPLRATQMLGEMLSHLNPPEAQVKSQRVAHENPKNERQLLEKLLRENEYLQLLTSRKIEATIRKEERQAKTLLLYDYLATRDAGLTADRKPAPIVAVKSSQASPAVVSKALQQQQMRHDILVLEQTMLEAKLRELCG